MLAWREGCGYKKLKAGEALAVDRSFKGFHESHLQDASKVVQMEIGTPRKQFNP